MPARNYDTTNKRPYPRVTTVILRYPTTGVPMIEYVEQQAIVDADNVVRHLEGGVSSQTLDLTQITQPVQAVNPTTGADIPGLTYTADQVMLGILAFIRANQKKLDGV